MSTQPGFQGFCSSAGGGVAVEVRVVPEVNGVTEFEGALGALEPTELVATTVAV